MTAIITNPDGYSLAVCTCPRGPHLGARKVETPCCCEDCGYITADQLDAIREAILAPMRELHLHAMTRAVELDRARNIAWASAWSHFAALLSDRLPAENEEDVA